MEVTDQGNQARLLQSVLYAIRHRRTWQKQCHLEGERQIMPAPGQIVVKEKMAQVL